MTVLIGVAESAAILGVSVSAVTKMRRCGRLVAARTEPVFKFALTDIEAMKLARAGKKFGRRPASIEFVHTGGDK